MKLIFIKMIQFSAKINKTILGPNFFDPKLTRPKLFQTERTQRLTHLLSFRELVDTKGDIYDRSSLPHIDIARSTYPLVLPNKRGRYIETSPDPPVLQSPKTLRWVVGCSNAWKQCVLMGKGLSCILPIFDQPFHLKNLYHIAHSRDFQGFLLPSCSSIFVWRVAGLVTKKATEAKSRDVLAILQLVFPDRTLRDW